MVAAIASIGLFSYSLYLTHEPVLVAAKQLALRAGVEPGTVPSAVLITVIRSIAAIVCGYLFYRVLEMRAVRASRMTASRVRAEAALAT